MASQVPIDDNSNTKSEEGTVAFHKKRARRVSFAENTSVHIFDRDEDSGTPLEPKPASSPSDELGSDEHNHERAQLFWNVDEDDNDNNNEDDDMDEPGSRSPFLRFVGSPSSGGSTVGSANSNDEDNFFGPVSANFIRRDLLDSSASDANHDQTMDSTAFSMHFRSLARSDSEVELKTSTRVHLSFDEKTPTHDSVPTNTGTPMLMTLAKKSNFQPSISTSKSGNKSESNDMSIVGEYHYKYDYGELSPSLDALITEPSDISILKSPKYSEAMQQNVDSLMDLSCDEGNNLEGIIGDELVNEDAFQIKSNLDFSTIGQVNPSPKNTIPSKSPLYVTPSHKHSSVFVRTENQEHVLSIQSVQKSISKLNMLEASPFSAALNARIQDSTIKSVTRPSMMTPLNTLLEKNYKSPLLNFVKDSGHLSYDVQKKRAREISTNMDDVRAGTPNNVFPLTHTQNLVEIASHESIQKLQESSRNIGYKDNKNTNDLPQSFDFSAQKRLKVVNTTEFERSPFWVEKSGTLISTEEEMVDIKEVSPTNLLENEEHEKFLDKFMGSDIEIGEINGASEVLNEGADIQSCKKNLHDQFCQSPSKKQPYNTLQDEDMMVEITTKIHTSPKVNVDPGISSEKEISPIVHKIKNPTELNATVSNKMKEVLCPSVDKLNLHTIDRLSDVVDQFFMSKTYQLLSDEIQPQKSVDISKNYHTKASEIKLLLCKFVHEKAKSQLLQVKREKLLEKAKILASGISESEEIMSKFQSQKPPTVPIESISVNMKDIQERQIESDKVTSARKELNDIDKRIENLTKKFHKSCKMKEELSPIDTITFVNNYLKKQASCHIIRKDMQLWVVDNFQSGNGCHSVDLNYRDLMTQRLTVNAGPVPSVSISHELNDVNISKTFKHMEACTSFRFVFDDVTTQKHIDATSLAKETQVTGGCFGNLLDVMEEIQNARIEPKTTPISTRFHTPSADQLDLELCFFDTKHGRKATVTLNISCLKRGIYPSEIVPYQIHIQPDKLQKSSPTFVDDITSALQDLETGFLRIQSICRCISNLISPPIM